MLSTADTCLNPPNCSPVVPTTNIRLHSLSYWNIRLVVKSKQLIYPLSLTSISVKATVFSVSTLIVSSPQTTSKPLNRFSPAGFTFLMISVFSDCVQVYIKPSLSISKLLKPTGTLLERLARISSVAIKFHI